MSKLKYSDAYVEHVLGQLESPLREEFDAHLSECEECRAEVEATRNALFTLPLVVSQSDPPASLRQRILGDARDSAVPPRTRDRWKPAAIAAAVVAAFLGLASIYQYRVALENRARLTELEQELVELQTSSQSVQASLDALLQPGVLLLEMGGTDAFPEVQGRVFVNPDLETARLFIRNLPVRTDALTYQLWVLPESGDPLPSLTFESSGALTEIAAVLPSLASEIQGFAATVEPVGGSAQPTGEMVVVGVF